MRSEPQNAPLLPEEEWQPLRLTEQRLGNEVRTGSGSDRVSSKNTEGRKPKTKPLATASGSDSIFITKRFAKAIAHFLTAVHEFPLKN
jgi:hypothetical protein